MTGLASAIDNTQRSLRTIYLKAQNDVQGFQTQFEELFRIAAVGLRGANPDVETAVANLQQLQTEMLQDGNAIRSANFKSYMKIGVAIILPCVFVAIPLDLLWHSNYVPPSVFDYFTSTKYSEARLVVEKTQRLTEVNQQVVEQAKRTIEDESGKASQLYKIMLAMLAGVFWIPAGAAFGNLLIFISRSAVLTMDNIVLADEFRWKPAESYAVVITFSLALGVVLAFQILQLGLFGTLLNDFTKTEPAIAFLVGLTTALGFTAVREILLSLRVTKRD
jgi:hypothetical protein